MGGWRISVALFSLAFLLLAIALLAARIHNFDLSSLLLGLTLPALIAVAFFLFHALSAVRDQEQRTVVTLGTTETFLQESEERFRQMADNIQEIFWMIDAQTRQTLYINAAFETITGRSRETLTKNPLSYEEIIHPADRVQILAKLEEATRTGVFDERFRIIIPNGETRWVWSRGFPIKDQRDRIRRLVGTALDITSQKEAEEEVIKNLALAKSAWAETDAMREATLALTQDLRMDNVLDTLLRSLSDLVPFETAEILLLESDSRLFVARTTPRPVLTKSQPDEPATIDATQFPIVQRVLKSQNDIAVEDTRQYSEWRSLTKQFEIRSWLCIPLIASHRVLGLLCTGSSAPHRFTAEHQRLARSLAIPAAAAIQNARLYECAKIYGSELEKRTSDLQDVQNALMRFQSGRPS
jgi:PAS domain S-box-containing protein